jgi:hypothetical protein
LKSKQKSGSDEKENSNLRDMLLREQDVVFVLNHYLHLEMYILLVILVFQLQHVRIISILVDQKTLPD